MRSTSQEIKQNKTFPQNVRSVPVLKVFYCKMGTDLDLNHTFFLSFGKSEILFFTKKENLQKLTARVNITFIGV